MMEGADIIKLQKKLYNIFFEFNVMCVNFKTI
jgi:hypothetical protein